MPLIDCPYYEEWSGQYKGQCWNEHPWSDWPDSCKVPGEESPICNRKKNGWKVVDGKEVFLKKVDSTKLKKALDKFNYKESLKPENMLKRIISLEEQIEKLQKR